MLFRRVALTVKRLSIFAPSIEIVFVSITSVCSEMALMFIGLRFKVDM